MLVSDHLQRRAMLAGLRPPRLGLVRDTPLLTGQRARVDRVRPTVARAAAALAAPPRWRQQRIGHGGMRSEFERAAVRIQPGDGQHGL